MKKCHDIENLLPLYRDGALTDTEKRAVEEHLASCTICRKELAYLEKTHQLVVGMPEVEEPPWFRQKIMAQVRKEAEKKSLAPKWFHPLRIRIPLQIMATIIIAVLAVYIYRSGENSMKQILPGVQPPVVEMQKEGAEPPLQKAPQMSAPSVPSPEAVLRKGAAKDKVAPKKASGGSDVGQSAAPVSEPQSRYETEAADVRMGADRKTEKSLASGPHPNEQIYAKGDVAAPSVQAVPKEQKSIKAELSNQEDKIEDRGVFGAAKKKDSKKAAAPAAPHSMSAPVDAGTQPVSVSLYVRDVNAAIADVEKILAAYDTKIISRQILAGKAILQMTLPAKQGTDFVSRLKDIGQIHGKTNLFETKDQNAIIILEIAPLQAKPSF